jgi:hypothetical protein
MAVMRVAAAWGAELVFSAHDLAVPRQDDEYRMTNKVRLTGSPLRRLEADRATHARWLATAFIRGARAGRRP